MSFHLFSTLSRTIQPFEPIKPGKVGFYGCGPTVYTYAHIGNLRAYFVHDLLVRTLRRRGFEVTHVMNITDIGHLAGDSDTGEDKMLRSAVDRGKTVLEIANLYIEAFFRDIERLNIVRPSIVCRATEHISDMIALIERIEKAGYTYIAGGNVYFDITKFPYYGDLARLKLDELKAGARTTVDEYKRHTGDFVLWFTKSKFEHQALLWDSPWGKGYPGWHIECSAMSIKYLGEQFDIHAGGIDHIPVHHTNEIAQSEAATAKHPWVNYWVHNEFLVVGKEKMAKSTSNFLTLQTLVDAGYDPLDYRYLLLGAHYRSPIQFSYQALDGARNARASLNEKVQALYGKVQVPSQDDDDYLKYLNMFDSALDDDLSTPRALAALWGMLRDPTISPLSALHALHEMDTVLGLNLVQTTVIPLFTPEEEAEIIALVTERTEARKLKNFVKADSIRASLKEKGISIEDTPDGTVLKPLCFR
ncbi:Cysteine--tRNA ligase [Pillotina sp. SPG140]|jgi:cysteinyl-tRNA synthetase